MWHPEVIFLTLEKRITKNSRIQKGCEGLVFTWSLRFDDGFRWNAHTTFVQRQLAAGQTVGPAVVVAHHHRLAARLGPLAHSLARFNGLVLEVDCADWSIHGAEEEEQIWAAAGTLTSRVKGLPEPWNSLGLAPSAFSSFHCGWSIFPLVDSQWGHTQWELEKCWGMRVSSLSTFVIIVQNNVLGPMHSNSRRDRC